MENIFLNNWLNILRNCSYDNTYKMAWAKAITEIAMEVDYSEYKDNEIIEITLEDIAGKIIKYYWNQTIFFNLIQGSNPTKPPKILSLTKELISIYQRETNSMQPVRYEKAGSEMMSHEVLKKHMVKTIKSIGSTLKQDVSYRFLNLANQKYDLYIYEEKSDRIFINIDNLKILSDNSQLIFETINYRWALILETFNSTPRICRKVKIIDETDIKRKPLKQFMPYLDMDNPKHICFICGKEINESELSIDHVIPWSYLYSDDLWNLVYTHKGCNSSKRNMIPDRESIKRLEDRNKKLLKLSENCKKDKNLKELEIAIENNYVHKFWAACQG